MTEALLQKIHYRRLAGKATALATIIRTQGSTPCKAGAKMLVFPEGGAYGTIGGGCAEAEVKMKALSVLDDGIACTTSVWLLDDDAAQNGMICGGAMEVFIQVV